MKTKSEALFEGFLTANGLSFETIEKETNTPTPDYLVSIGTAKVVFEVKELTEDENFGAVDPAYPNITSSSRTVGEHVRRRIKDSAKQIQYGAQQEIPSVLLIYNNLDPVFQAFGTEAMDFVAAMYGAYTIVLNRNDKAASDWFNGMDQMFQQKKNTSFSAVGHLCDRGGTTSVTLFENIFAKVKLPIDQLPSCFKVPRIEVSAEPLTLP